MKSICCVLRMGGDFLPRHVQWLRDQCTQWMPDWTFRVWSDVPMRGATPLRSNWPRWWAKMEIMGESFAGPALIVDLDTVFLRPFEIQEVDKDTFLMIRDPYRDGSRGHTRLAGGFSYIPEGARHEIWRKWIEDPKRHIAESAGDDQVFYQKHFGDRVRVFQDYYIDQIVSYKAHISSLGIRPENRVVYFHGKPRPWELKEEWIPTLEKAA